MVLTIAQLLLQLFWRPSLFTKQLLALGFPLKPVLPVEIAHVLQDFHRKPYRLYFELGVDADTSAFGRREERIFSPHMDLIGARNSRRPRLPFALLLADSLRQSGYQAQLVYMKELVPLNPWIGSEVAPWWQGGKDSLAGVKKEEGDGYVRVVLVVDDLYLNSRVGWREDLQW